MDPRLLDAFWPQSLLPLELDRRSFRVRSGFGL